MPAVDEEKGQLVCDPALTFRHDYPPTKLMFMPDQEACRPDLLVRNTVWNGLD